MGLVETFIQKDEEVSMVGHVCYGMNRKGGRWASGGEEEFGVRVSST